MGRRPANRSSRRSDMSDAGKIHPIYDGDPQKLARWRPNETAPPSIAVWEITLRCDLGCRHCGSRAGQARPDELTTAEALHLVDEFADLGLKEVTLIGGEFYLREDWDQIAAAINRNGMLCSIVTGARQMTDQRIARAVAAGIGKISLSIDGLEATHDAIRASAGSWQAAVSAGRRISASGIDLSVNSQLNRLTMPELPGLADLLSDIGAKSWMVILTAAMGRGADHPQLLLEPYHLLALFPLLAAIKRDKLDPKGIAFFPGNNVGYFGPLAETLRYGAEQGYAWGGCGAGVSSLGIEADGSIKGCPSLPSADYVAGNIRARSLREIWSGAMQGGPRSPLELWGFCKSCAYAERCRAGCTWTSHVLFGRAGNNPFCHYRALTLAEAGKIERLEQEAAAPGEAFDFGRYRIIEDAMPADLDAEPLLAMTLAAERFGLRPGLTSLWSEEVLRATTGATPQADLKAPPSAAAPRL
jgi:radical SAM protein with 4Fe4S-binding SPASM domain